MGFSKSERQVSVSIFFIIYASLEVLRKYCFPDPLVLLAFDFLFGLVLFYFLPYRVIYLLFFINSFFLIHGLVVSIFKNQYPLFMLAGLREINYFLGGFLLATCSKIHFRKKDLIRLLLLGGILSGFGFLQVILGRDSILNFSPPEFNLGSSGGHGSFVPEFEALVGDVFRPNSVFPVTGKFGMFIGMLSAMCLAIGYKVREVREAWMFPLFWVLILINLVPFQRAVLYPLVCFLVFLGIKHLWFDNRTLLVGLIALVIGWLIVTELGQIVVERVVLFPGEVLSRLSYMNEGASLFSVDNLWGQGFGYYSNYSTLLGGGRYSDTYGGESGWLVLTASVGVGGTIIWFCVLWFESISSLFAGLFGISEEGPAFVAGFFGLIVMLWGTTHNIFGSPMILLTLGIMFGMRRVNSEWS